MIISLNFMAAYVLGGITLFPILFTLIYTAYLLYNRLVLPLYNFFSSKKPDNYNAIPDSTTSTEGLETDQLDNEDSSTSHLYKVGWLKVSRDEEQTLPDNSIGDMVKSYISGLTSKRSIANIYFSVLKYNTLYLYDSEKQLDCKGVIILDNHAVTTHPPGLQDFELFSKPSLIKLEDKTTTAIYYINCNRCIDKEDWYFAFIRASRYSTAATNQRVVDTTHFDKISMNDLITQVHSDEHHLQTQWLNAILGRLFLGVYRTQGIRDALYKKVNSKLDKINAKRPPFLGEITVRSVDPGQALPRFTQPKLLGISPTGELTVEAYLDYEGGFRIEIETVLKWKYSDRLRPLTMDLVLGITLKKIQGKILIKIKEPPTNRFWYGFYECPKMDWKVEPVLWEKRVGYSVVVRAIEQKIQEFIAETMVLPNFDDITFFPTNGVGGIFEVPPATAASSQEKVVKKKESDVISTKSAPTPIVTTTKSPVPIPVKKSKKDHSSQERYREDEALLSTAKSLPELFSNVPDRQQSKLRMQYQHVDKEENHLDEFMLYASTDARNKSDSLLSTSLAEPSITVSSTDQHKSVNGSSSTTVLGQIAIANPTNNHHESSVLELSISPDSLSSSPSSITIDDSLKSISHVLTDETNLVITPSTSTPLTYDTIQITYSQDSNSTDTSSLEEYYTNTCINDSSSKTTKLRKSSSLALLRPKAGASTAINKSPAMAHNKKKEHNIDTTSATATLA